MLEFLSWQTKIIHMESTYNLSSSSSSSSSASADSSSSVFQFCSFGYALYFSNCSAFSKSLFFFFGSVFSRSFFFFLQNWFFGSSNCLHLHLILQILLEFEKLEIHVDKLLHLSTRTWVFEARFCHQTRASKTRDASFLHGFKTLLTNNILSQTYASLQITSSNQYGLKLNEWLR